MLISCSIDLFCDYFCPWGQIFASVCHKSYFWRGGILPSCFSDSSVVYATSCGERWDAFKTAREPVLGRSANPVFFVADRKKVVAEVFFATWAGRRVCSDMQLTARLRRKRAATAKPINWRRNRKTSLVHSTHGFHQ